jgi:hypothetical protein
MNRLTTTTVLFLAGSLCAQPVTSPKGLETTEGNMSFVMWGAPRRLQSVDFTHQGSAHVFKSLSFRRDGNGGGAGAGARTFDASVIMGDAEWVVQSTVLDDNIKTGTATTVFTKKSVHFPDWTTPPAASPAAFDFKLVYDSPWPYAGSKPFVWSISYDNNTLTTPVATDRQHVPAGPATGASVALGTGCVATGRTGSFAHTATLANFGVAGGMALTAGVTEAPAGTPVLLMLDVVESKLVMPGLCSIVYALPTVQFGLGMADATGATVSKTFTFPYAAAVQGNELFTQGLAVDLGQPGLPVVVSDGRKGTMPAAPAPGLQCTYQWCALPGNSGQVYYGGGVIALLGT